TNVGISSSVCCHQLNNDFVPSFDHLVGVDKGASAACLLLGAVASLISFSSLCRYLIACSRGHPNPQIAASPSVHLGAGEPDDLRPSLGLYRNESAKIARRAYKHLGTPTSDKVLDPRISETRIDLLIELVDDFSRRVPGRADSSPARRLVPWHNSAT